MCNLRVGLRENVVQQISQRNDIFQECVDICVLGEGLWENLVPQILQ